MKKSILLFMLSIISYLAAVECELKIGPDTKIIAKEGLTLQFVWMLDNNDGNNIMIIGDLDALFKNRIPAKITGYKDTHGSETHEFQLISPKDNEKTLWLIRL
jgi:hypothetical protein